ncbi:lamin tail domain-containing protein [Candidatus Bipolaricaulota bacterium]|nr:lamin tail domain-containing protein [Candidatus Bipolaricaulota bacterium]
MIKTRPNSGRFRDKRVRLASLAIVLILLVSAFSFVSVADQHEKGLSIVEIIREGEHETVILLNLSREQIDLCGYVLEVDEGDRKFDFTEQSDCKTTIPPLSVMRIHSGPGSSSYYASWQDLPWTQEEVWNDQEGKASLINPEGEVVSTFKYGE